MDIKAINNLTEEQKLTREDYKNLIMIAGPILVILILLLSSKDSVGQGFSAFIFGYNPNSGESLPWILEVYQNAAGDPDSAGFYAVLMLVILLFLDPEIRKAPGKIVRALADAGVVISELFLLLIAVSVIDVCISFTNFTGILTIDILTWLKSVSTFEIFGEEYVIGGALYLMLPAVITLLWPSCV